MSSPRVDVISIGCLSRNLLWGEQQPVRTPHSTTVLIRTGKRNILVDPGLPAAVVAARLYERTGLKPGQIDTVFLTNFRPAHRAGLGAFSSAKMLIHETERELLRPELERMREAVGLESEDAKVLTQELAILDALEPAPDKIATGIDLFPLPGFTPGTCGLLISMVASTILVAGDAVPTQEHFLAMQVLPESFDRKQAGESMREVYEIADLIIPGHDNMFLNPRTQGI
jgi:glyoxylase-like metal-dependent hydrolase (beta-lactamase superfamily II)